MINKMIPGDDTLTLTLFVGALEGIMGFVALRVAWLGEGDMPYLAPSIAVVGWVLFKVFQKFIRPILE